VAKSENDVCVFLNQRFLNFTSAGAAASVGEERGLIAMIDRLRHAAAIWASATAMILMAVPTASAQGPSEAQRAAIKAQCRSDYIAHCSSVPPGGAPALQCLQKNMASLSSSCQSAVRAVEASVEKPAPKTETTTEAKPDAKPAAASEAKPDAKPDTASEAKPEAAPATAAKPTTETTAAKPAAAKPAASAASGKPSDAQIAAIRSACRSDYPKVCAGVPTGGAPALQCLEKNKSKLSASCGKAVAAAGGGATSTAGAAASGATASANPAEAAAPAATVLVLRPMRPREVLFVLRSACGADVRALCPGIPAGGGRIIECLATQQASLSSDCRGVLGQFAAR
jgi:hypothetical protein